MPLTPEETNTLLNMLMDLRLETKRNLRESRITTYTYDEMKRYAALAKSVQTQANAMHSALKALGVRGIGEPLNIVF